MLEFDFPPLQPLVFTVTALSNYLRELLETDEILRDVWVRGEISNFSQPRSGHLYFTLKDSEAQLRCVMWKSQTFGLRFNPKDGQSVEAHGAMSFYPAGGQVQLYIDEMQPVGEGQLYQEFLRLKARLEAEGLFAAELKRPLPQFPRHIGVVTSPSGAALQDILNTLRRRLPLVRVTLAPTPVQGAEAPAGIVAALQSLNSLPDLDLIILARGGGSIEDLWSFNDESVAYAIRASRVPVISGVGHETDFTIADFAADLRAPTPTAAAELATPITSADLAAELLSIQQSLSLSLKNKIASLRQDLLLAENRLLRHSPAQRVRTYLQFLDETRERLERAMSHYLSQHQLKLQNQIARLESVSPMAVLRRGFAIVSDAQTHQLISRRNQISPNQSIQIQLSDGKVAATISGDIP
ncbi:MAG TPA: exodeoxyribonuclease VII large subunit [Anaerolineaceae bacterium]|nr:exodeoxyribonuclease VII large subunit [Anaerolineaceae bacterium]